jgi:hypothetical protein
LEKNFDDPLSPFSEAKEWADTNFALMHDLAAQRHAAAAHETLDFGAYPDG